MNSHRSLDRRDRLWQGLLVLSTVGFSWLAMQAVHEAGHVLHLLATGGSIERLTLHPLKLSHTLPATNPAPLATVIGGPLWGVMLPLVGWGVLSRLAPSRAYLAAFFAGFCLVANGAYLAGDALLQGGDGLEFVLLGTPPWLLVVVGILLVAAGLGVWNGLGCRFGFGPTAQSIVSADALTMAGLTATLVLVEVAFFG